MKLGHFLHWRQRGTFICCYFLLTLPWVFNWHNYLQWPVCTTQGSPEPTVSLWHRITAPNASYCNVNHTVKLTADGNPTADDSEIHLLLYLHVLFIYQRSTFCSANMLCWIFVIFIWDYNTFCQSENICEGLNVAVYYNLSISNAEINIKWIFGDFFIKEVFQINIKHC